jgi:23S rRNA (uracil1939-C5)-methyltransferase
MSELINNLDITALVHGGRGIGRYEGKAVFVPLTMPGDRVSCRVIKSRKRYIEAELCEVVVPSESRREPPCPLFGVCGGCQWQHMPYPEQLRSKEQTFADLLLRNKLTGDDSIKPIMPAPDEWRYRNRVQLKCRLVGDKLHIGFYRHGSHDVVDVDSCLLVAPEIQKILKLLRCDLQSAPDLECVVQVDLSCDDNGAVRVVLHVLPAGSRKLRRWLKDFAGRNQLNACIKVGRNGAAEVIHGEGDLVVRVDRPELRLNYGPGGFVQVNSVQNRNMIAAMLKLLDLDGTEKVLELFCGMGNFSLPLARRVKQLVGVEDHQPSIVKAKANASDNHIDNVEFRAADASAVLAMYQDKNELELVVLDPPRTGSFAVASQLQKVRPDRILYVSCDPATLVRDLTPLSAGDYQVVSSQPFDLFPQTWHIESMTLLRRMG